MAGNVKTHRGNQDVTLSVVPDGARQRVVGRIGGAEIGEKDRFMLKPGERLQVTMRLPETGKAKCEFFVWKENKGQELPPEKKKYDPSDPANVCLEEEVSAAPGTMSGMVLHTLFDGDLSVSFGESAWRDTLGFSIGMEHSPEPDGPRYTHAHYQFALRVTYDGNEVCWDPDVHDVAPG